LSEHQYWFVCRLREKTSYTVLHTYYTCEEVFDGLVWLGNYHAQAGHAVRLVRFRVGALTLTYLTNVLDPSVLPIQEIARLYARRWDIELAFLTLKEHLGLHLWWSSKVVVILVQVWACLILAQLLQAVRLEIACRAQVEPFEVSLPLLVKFVPQPWAMEQDLLATCVQRGRQLGLIRPSSRTRVQGPEVAARLPTISAHRQDRRLRVVGYRSLRRLGGSVPAFSGFYATRVPALHRSTPAPTIYLCHNRRRESGPCRLLALFPIPKSINLQV